MNDGQQAPAPEDDQRGIFERYPKLSIILIAVVAYGLLLGMCVFVAVLMIRG